MEPSGVCWPMPTTIPSRLIDGFGRSRVSRASSRPRGAVPDGPGPPTGAGCHATSGDFFFCVFGFIGSSPWVDGR